MELKKTDAICLRISPWSRTSHVVSWLTPEGLLSTVVKGAERPKSMFLGQYDLNYTCELVYYARGFREARALRECSPLVFRSPLREDWRSMLVSDRFRYLAGLFAHEGPDAAAWFALLARHLDRLSENAGKPQEKRENLLALLLDFEIETLSLGGLRPEIMLSEGSFSLRGERKMNVSREVVKCISAPLKEKNIQILLDTARVIGVFYTFHVEKGVEGRRQILQTI